MSRPDIGIVAGTDSKKAVLHIHTVSTGGIDSILPNEGILYLCT
jgi:hypothetical protein